jgi:hypothetical protein
VAYSNIGTPHEYFYHKGLEYAHGRLDACYGLSRDERRYSRANQGRGEKFAKT